jgi:hypothetical protein
MRIRDHLAAATCSIALSISAAVPAFAQSNTSTWFEGTSARLSAPPVVMRPYEIPQAADQSRVSPPPNLTFPELYRATIDSMLHLSPTFRRQCSRLANAPHVTVRFRNLYYNDRAASRAVTNIVRTSSGGLDATVGIQPLEDLAELIAHELEHIIEQMDGVDLLAQSSLPGTGVRTRDDGSYETIRAVRVGALVAQETRAGR